MKIARRRRKDTGILLSEHIPKIGHLHLCIPTFSRQCELHPFIGGHFAHRAPLIGFFDSVIMRNTAIRGCECYANFQHGIHAQTNRTRE